MKMRELRNIIDSWNMIEKYNLKGWIEQNGVILIPDAEYERLMSSVKNKQYIKNITHK